MAGMTTELSNQTIYNNNGLFDRPKPVSVGSFSILLAARPVFIAIAHFEDSCFKALKSTLDRKQIRLLLGSEEVDEIT